MGKKDSWDKEKKTVGSVSHHFPDLTLTRAMKKKTMSLSDYPQLVSIYNGLWELVIQGGDTPPIDPMSPERTHPHWTGFVPTEADPCKKTL